MTVKRLRDITSVCNLFPSPDSTIYHAVFGIFGSGLLARSGMGTETVMLIDDRGYPIDTWEGYVIVIGMEND
ncbi:UNVERIFIED_CONTAM: hypothetical protein NCL1_17104 [Trichonephila clavipes]